MSRVSTSSLALGIVAVLLGMVGAYGVRQYLDRPIAEAEAKRPARPLTIPFAIADLKPGRVIRMGDIMVQQITPAEFSARNLGSMNAIASSGFIIGRTVKEEIRQGEPFTAAKLYPEGAVPSIADRLKPGLRAVSVMLAYNDAMNGFTPAGSFVDVLFRSNEVKLSEFDSYPEQTRTIVENVEVLAFNDQTGTNIATDEKKGTPEWVAVSLAVTPEQAQTLMAVADRGTLRLSLRSESQGEELDGRRGGALTLDDILQINRGSRPVSSEVYRGTSRHSLTFKRNTVIDESFGGTDATGKPIFPPIPRQVANRGGSPDQSAARSPERNRDTSAMLVPGSRP